MKKMNVFTKAILFVFAVSVLSCNNFLADDNDSSAKMGTFTVGVNTGAERTIFPDKPDFDKMEYELVCYPIVDGTAQRDNATTFKYSSKTDLETKQNQLPEGEWELVLWIIDEANKTKFQIRTESIRIEANKNEIVIFDFANAHVLVEKDGEYIFADKGKAKVTLYFPAFGNVEVVKAGLFSIDDEKPASYTDINFNKISFDYEELEIKDAGSGGEYAGKKYVVYEKDEIIAANGANGAYWIKFKMYNESGNEIKPGYSEVIRIAAGRTSSATRVLNDITYDLTKKLPSVYFSKTLKWDDVNNKFKDDDWFYEYTYDIQEILGLLPKNGNLIKLKFNGKIENDAGGNTPKRLAFTLFNQSKRTNNVWISLSDFKVINIEDDGTFEFEDNLPIIADAVDAVTLRLVYERDDLDDFAFLNNGDNAKHRKVDLQECFSGVVNFEKWNGCNGLAIPIQEAFSGDPLQKGEVVKYTFKGTFDTDIGLFQIFVNTKESAGDEGVELYREDGWGKTLHDVKAVEEVTVDGMFVCNKTPSSIIEFYMIYNENLPLAVFVPDGFVISRGSIVIDDYNTYDIALYANDLELAKDGDAYKITPTQTITFNLLDSSSSTKNPVSNLSDLVSASTITLYQNGDKVVSASAPQQGVLSTDPIASLDVGDDLVGSGYTVRVSATISGVAYDQVFPIVIAEN